MRYLPVARRSLPEAMAMTPVLAELCERTQQPVCSGAAFSERAIVLGALQVAGRVLREPLRESVLRRSTSGTAIYFDDGGMVVTLVLPSIDTVFRDATPATVLNRNLRLFLAGFEKARIPATYFGREWIAHQHRALGLVGMDVTPGGALIIEMWIAHQGSLAIPRPLLTDLEASCDRYRGKPALCLTDVTSFSPWVVAEKMIAGIAERAGSELEVIDALEIPASDPTIHARWSPLPEDSTVDVPVAIPIGFLDSGTSPSGERFIGGDLLGPVHALGFNASREGSRGALVGATWEDIASLLQTKS